MSPRPKADGGKPITWEANKVAASICEARQLSAVHRAFIGLMGPYAGPRWRARRPSEMVTHSCPL